MFATIYGMNELSKKHLGTQENILETVKKTIKIDTLRDCIIIGIVYYIGARPVQVGKLSGGDFIVDTENSFQSPVPARSR